MKKKYNLDVVINDLDVVFDRGFAHGLLGVNGAGKSTLIKIMTNLIYPDQGEIDLDGKISMLPEQPYLPDNLSAYQIVSFACKVQKRGVAVDALLKEVLLKEEAWFKPIRTYSKGMKQRAAIAYALAGEPEWLILDEPMSGLDALGRKQMLEIFKKRKDSGMSLIMCSHAVTDLVRLCQQVHIMASGKITETIEINEHTMQEAENLESRLVFWSASHAVD